MIANIPIEHQVHVSLDGDHVLLPEKIQSFKAICSYLNTLAQRRHRIVATFAVEIEPIYIAAAWPDRKPSCRISATTAGPETLHLGIVQAALRQVESARKLVRDTAVQVQIDDGCIATEQWKTLAEHLRQPLETMRALPKNFCESRGAHAEPEQLRQWQFEQLASIRNDVDEACRRKDGRAILHALENRVMSWLDNLSDLLSLWRETLLLGFQMDAAA
jgi:hypothetical protein